MQHDDAFTGKHVLQLRREIEKKYQQFADSTALLEQKKAELAEIQSEVRHIMLSNNVLRSHIDMLKGLLRQASEEILASDDLSTDTDRHTPSTHDLKRNPMEMVKPKFKGMQLGDIVELVLEQHQTALTTTEISRIIYDPQDKEEFARARNSLSAELRSGATRTPPRWYKKGRSTYVAPSHLRVPQVLPSTDRKGGDACVS